MSTFCVYLTVYSGNKLPMFYIGSTSTIKVNNGYHGSVSSKEYGKLWKEELKNFPNLFKTKVVSVHTSREEAFEKEEKLQKKMNAVSNPLYINKSFANSKFSLKQHAPWTREKFKNRIPWNKGKIDVYSEETKNKMSKNKKGRPGRKHTEETKLKLRGPNPKKALIGEKNGMFGKTHSVKIKVASGLSASERFKGKSYEELYGKEKADVLKQKRSASTKGKDNSFSKNPRFDNTEYTFMNLNTGEIIHCTRWVLIHSYGVSKPTACGIINHNSVACGWTLFF